jgi:amidohydrolase
MSERREKLLRAADGAAPKYRRLALTLYDHPEIGLEEVKAATWISEALEAEGFAVERGVADLPTAFVAKWGDPGARPVIAFLAEYDALPELGHACGHNLIAGAASLAGVAMTRILSPVEAQIRVIGCPAEETYAGKAQLVERGIFGDVDVALMNHGFYAHIGGRPASGRKSVVLEFRGKSAHAAGAPERGVNALDALLLTFNGIGLMRQQLRDDARVHGIITHGGDAANIIPDYTRGEFYVRSFDIEYLEELERRLIACARGAAEATGTDLKVSAATLTMLPVKHNTTLERRYEDKVRSLGGTVCEEPPAGGAGSTDFGNISQLIPAVHAYFQVSEDRVGAHTVEFGLAAKSEQGLAGMVIGAKALALTALDLIDESDLLTRSRREFEAGSAGVSPAFGSEGAER